MSLVRALWIHEAPLTHPKLDGSLTMNISSTPSNEGPSINSRNNCMPGLTLQHQHFKLLIIIISKSSKTFCQQISSPSSVFILVIFSNTKLFLMWKVSFTYMIELYNYFRKSRLNYNHAYLLIYFVYLLWLCHFILLFMNLLHTYF